MLYIANGTPSAYRAGIAGYLNMLNLITKAEQNHLLIT
jgi:hypothetical protein